VLTESHALLLEERNGLRYLALLREHRGVESVQLVEVVRAVSEQDVVVVVQPDELSHRTDVVVRRLDTLSPPFTSSGAIEQLGVALPLLARLVFVAAQLRIPVQDPASGEAAMNSGGAHSIEEKVKVAESRGESDVETDVRRDDVVMGELGGEQSDGHLLQH